MFNLSFTYRMVARERNLVVKHNNLINARNGFSLAEIKLYLMAIAQIKPDDTDFKKYRIHVKDFSQAIGSRSKAEYGRIKEATNNLMKKIIELPRKEENKYTLCQVFGPCDYHVGEGYVDIKFYPELREYLLQLKDNYTIMELEVLLNMKSVTSIKMYMLLNQYKKIGKRKFQLDELKWLLKLEDSYTLYGDFKKYVIKKAIIDFEKYADIQFRLEEKKKKNRKVEELVFHISKKQIVRKIEFESPIFKKLKQKFLLTSGQSMEVLSKFDGRDNTLSMVLDEIQSRYKKGEIEKLGAYTHKVLMNYSFERSLFDIEMEEENEKKRIDDERLQDLKAQQEKLKVEFEQQKTLAIQKLEEKIEAGEKKKLRQEFDSCKSSFRKTNSKASKKLQPVLRRNFLAEKFLDEHQYNFDTYLAHIGFNQK